MKRLPRRDRLATGFCVARRVAGERQYERHGSTTENEGSGGRCSREVRHYAVRQERPQTRGDFPESVHWETLPWFSVESVVSVASGYDIRRLNRRRRHDFDLLDPQPTSAKLAAYADRVCGPSADVAGTSTREKSLSGFQFSCCSKRCRGTPFAIRPATSNCSREIRRAVPGLPATSTQNRSPASDRRNPSQPRGVLNGEEGDFLQGTAQDRAAR